ncbi:hypothetical protein LTR35_016568 [Friedmanniomyces endolithicus]|uniref:endo-1,3(4)-beta-glucanase n=1 Tax=Friedmanniomyces endolithicus TaxID=329885 RepID=A0AAN6FTJ2_9PEZI|nr:hypothetical protein LTR35_016568 [Friedmanniomyces endolithicus]KAK0285368.1 hypothetical protein LTS00_010997 [Friedmanniomyces endolithicus]KAK0322524.1 hypothetical protein LTR82_006483 [Friedmanniomyces endolithicus]KAK0977682.1 hypothetical protein LTR54_016133 [Friedmanniomyces endolithicus]
MAFYTFLLALFVGLSVAGYTLEDDYTAGGNFFDMFTFFTGGDPTNGYVNYVDQSVASQNGYIDASSAQIYIGTDAVNVTNSAGRNSVRLTSNKSYSSGLVILDLDHMPGGICGTWPAFWMVGPNWPSAGEIDIIEGVNSQSSNAMTLHTGAGCSITNNDAFSGSIDTANCDVNAAGQNKNAGCSIGTSNAQSYGSGFNANNGGVYATNYDSSAISIYFFPRGSIPSDISSGSPNPSGWGKPLAQFQGGCDIASKINDQQIVFDLTFCGDWAGEVWSTDSTCSSKASTCNDYVLNNPAAFKDAYWSINSLKVYSIGSMTASNVASYGLASTSSSSVSVAATLSSASVWAASYSPSASPTTFAFSSKASAPIFPTSAPATSSSSVSVAAVSTSSTSVWAASYNSSASPSTFVLSSKTFAPISPTGAPATPPYSISNSTDSPHLSSSGTGLVSAPFPSGTGHASAPYPSGTGIFSAPLSLSSTGLTSSVPAAVSPPTIISAASAPSAAPSSPSESSVAAQPATSSNIPTQSYDWQTRSWTHHHHYTPVPQAVRRHLRGHKRHGGGLF